MLWQLQICINGKNESVSFLNQLQMIPQRCFLCNERFSVSSSRDLMCDRDIYCWRCDCVDNQILSFAVCIACSDSGKIKNITCICKSNIKFENKSKKIF